MGLFADLLYFGPRLGPIRTAQLLGAKLTKAAGKRRLAAALRRPESDAAFFARLGLPQDSAERRVALRRWWGSVAADPVLAPRPGGPASGGASRDPVDGDAEAVLGGRQRLFGEELEVGWPPRWDWRGEDRPEGERFAADVRTTWEVQRLQGILPLAAASGGEDPRWARAYVEALVHFERAHPPPRGIAWASALEGGLRLVALAQGVPRILKRDAFGEAELPILRLIDRQARVLAADLSLDKAVRGNHLLGELAGLLAAGHLLPPARKAWWGEIPVNALMEGEILRQFYPDGVSVEQSLPYEKFILEFLIVAGALAALREEPWSAAVRERLARTADHLAAVAAPDGTLPPVGDNDSGRGAWWGDHDPLDLQETLWRARRIFGPAPAPEEPRVLPFTAVPEAPPGIAVRTFPHGGHAAIRCERGNFLFLRAGPFGWGPRGPASHSHADWLAPVLWIRGEPFLIDPGVFGYGIDPETRNAFRTAAAHNGLVFEPDPGPVPSGTFRWRRFGARASLRVEEAGSGVLLEGTVEGEGALRWHRSIRYDHLDESWLIEDRVGGHGARPLGWALHLAPGIRVEPPGTDGELRAILPSGSVIQMRMTPPGEVRVAPGWVARGYGRREPAPVIHRRLSSGIHASLIVIRRGASPRQEESP